MRTTYSILGPILIVLAAFFHIYVFSMESLTWRKPITWKSFGVSSQEKADIIAPMAFNQGFYNLFLASGALLGLVLLGVNSTVGFTLMLFTALCMGGAGLVLFFSVKTSRRAALIQAGPALLGALFVVLGRIH